MTDEKRRVRPAPKRSSKKDWKPLPGPQTEALKNKADVLFYGGAAGGGKTELIIGAAYLKHKRTIIFRREFTQLRAIIDRMQELFADTGRLNKATMVWTFEDGRTIELGAVQHLGDERKYHGRPHDLKAFDELTHFSEMQFRTLCGWLRSANARQRCRVVATGNPPADAEGDWVVRYFAPWLDPAHPRPAAPGELRWFTTLDGRETELESGEPFTHKGERIVPQSRSFIPARVEDNPYYINSGYKTTLQALPEPMRSKLLRGDFTAGREDNPYQLIPTLWVEQAVERHKRQERPGAALSCIGVDVARGGADSTVITLRYEHWFARQLVYPGASTPSGDTVAQLVLAARGGNACPVQVDVIGVGASVFDALRRHIGLAAVAMNAAEGSDAADKSGQLAFVNRRAEWWWRLREALDPETGAGVALPDDRQLLADLMAPRFRLTLRGILVESKDHIKQRLGRSPDRGDSLVLANALPHVPGAGFFDYYASLGEE